MDRDTPNYPACANITWDHIGQPISQEFGDIYFSKDNGLEETRFVFLNHNHLTERWKNLAPGATFVIAETGFGTGLNFLAAWQLWAASDTASAQLHFISVEKYPLHKHDLTQALSLWPELNCLSEKLIAQYPPVDCTGFHRLHFGNVHLTLIFAEAEIGLSELLPIVHTGPALTKNPGHWSTHYSAKGSVDAWFLDGFAPAKNPAMWSDALFSTVAKLSGSHTTFATFTAAGAVKRGLQQVGFNVEKVKGHGNKRQMLRGQFGVKPEVPASTFRPKPDPSWHLIQLNPSPTKVTSASIVGAGLAGATTAFALAQRGIPVTVIESKQIAAGASGNPQGILYSKLSHTPGSLADFNLCSFLYAQRFYQEHAFFQSYGQACGVLQLLDDDAELKKAEDISRLFGRSTELVQLLNSTEASARAKIALSHPALFYPNTGWINPPALCRALLNHPLISLIENTCVDQFEQKNGQWILRQSQSDWTHQCQTLILCNAHHSKRFSHCDHLPTTAIRGQISVAKATETSHPLSAVLCAEGYIAPAQAQHHCLGATFNLKSLNTQLDWQDHKTNVDNIKVFSKAFSELTVSSLDDGRVSFRCSTPDYLPAVGPVPRLEQNLTRFAAFRTNLKKTVDAPGEYYENLYVNVGHGSRGLTYTPLCAEILACQLTGAPLPLPRTLMLHLHPARFLIRNLARNKL